MPLYVGFAAVGGVLATLCARTFFGAAAIALGSSLVVAAMAAFQRRVICSVLSDQSQLQTTHESIVENLPVGLFVIQGRTVTLTNSAFDRQIRRKPGETANDAFRRAMHPEDASRVKREFDLHVSRGQRFHIRYRLVDAAGHVDHFESRGVPVPTGRAGDVRYICFSINITSIVSSQKRLQTKNEEIATANRQLKWALHDLQRNFDAMVQSWVKAVEAKDPYTAGHSERVMSYSVRIGERIGLSPTELRTLKVGTLIHDIGKIGVPDAILNKPGPLTDGEHAIVRFHPEVGASLIAEIPSFADCLPIVRHHHERLDGSGYPDGLKGDEISVLVRIVAVADSFDAMTSDRAYRKARSVEETLSILVKEAESGKLDAKIVAVLADIVEEEGILWRESSEMAA
ncbi:MAG: HD domain-containing phosphohydrolase [Fimbriimonadaceae bacterium]